MTRDWRAVVRVDLSWEERETMRGRRYSWRLTEVRTLVLECGHTQVRRGYRSPPSRVLCKQCAAGEPRVPVAPGSEQPEYPGIKSPIVRALFGGEP